MKVLFKKNGTCENLIIVPEGTHYSITVEGENEDKKLVFSVGGEQFVLESTKDICQKSRGANPQLATDIFNEIIFYLIRLPVTVDVWDIGSIQSRVLKRYEEAWQQLETCLSDWPTEKDDTNQNQDRDIKAPFIFSKILGSLKEKLGPAVEEWFREAEVELKDDNLHLFIKSPFCREVIKRRCSSFMKECLLGMGLGNMEIIFDDGNGDEDV